MRVGLNRIEKRLHELSLSAEIIFIAVIDLWCGNRKHALQGISHGLFCFAGMVIFKHTI